MLEFRAWVSAHDNGWETWIARRSDGTHSAWVAGPRADMMTWHLRDFRTAEAVALSALHEMTGHVCGSGCILAGETLTAAAAAE
jgi:hypothetical protein